MCLFLLLMEHRISRLARTTLSGDIDLYGHAVPGRRASSRTAALERVGDARAGHIAFAISWYGDAGVKVDPGRGSSFDVLADLGSPVAVGVTSAGKIAVRAARNHGEKPTNRNEQRDGERSPAP
jgi:hypothetical protein